MYEFTEIQNEKILLAFLNWGKGHLSRCIDVCRRLSSQKNTIFVACSTEDFLILSEYLPTLTHIPFQDYPFKTNRFMLIKGSRGMALERILELI